MVKIAFTIILSEYYDLPDFDPNNLSEAKIKHYLYNDANATRAVIGRCPWSIRVQIHGWRHRKLVFFVLFNMASDFENVCEIISDWGSESFRKSLAGAIYKEEKWRNGDQKGYWLLDNA